DNFRQTLTYLRESGLQVVACTEKTDVSVYDIDFSVPTAVVLGSEEDGIATDLIRKADHLCKIPMFGKIESLNVSVSAGVILYETVRQRNLKQSF
ncbi:MAG: 23S rRNA (guanosine(2251)-2'-O)-methyltransferase RlmB, partial [Verrucomicrobia bacterium]|nr:23S rRNA (guanosine(2251)-2'-O)-methyltransferase RlmB [Cytophagales bacterium]